MYLYNYVTKRYQSNLTSNNLKWLIIGGGAMGSLFAGRLALYNNNNNNNNNNNISLLSNWKEHVDCINKNGLEIKLSPSVLKETNNNNNIFTSLQHIQFNATTDVHSLLSNSYDVVMICVKGKLQTIKAAEYASKFVKKNNDGVIITLQNGVGYVDCIESIINQKNMIITGTTSLGTMVETGIVTHTGIGDTVLVDIDGAYNKLLNNIINHWCHAGINASLFTSKHINYEIEGKQLQDCILWSKLLVNAAINPMVAILKVTNGALLKSSAALDLMYKIIDEFMTICEEANIPLMLRSRDKTNDDIFICRKKDVEKGMNHVLRVVDNTQYNQASMLVDVLNRNRSEIDVINRAIVNKGHQLNIVTPVNSTICALIDSLDDVKYDLICNIKN